MYLDIPLNLRSVPRIINYIITNTINKRQRIPKALPRTHAQILYLEVCRSCNLNCPMCLRELLPQEERTGIMELRDVKKAVKNAGNVMGVSISGWGEPTLHPQFLEILNVLSRHGLLISFDTNGLLLREVASDLVKIKTLYHVGISFDFLPGTLKNVHSIEKALEGAQKLEEEKKAKGRRYPLVRVTMTIMKHNIGIITEIIKLIHEYGLKWFDCHEVIVFDPTYIDGPYAPPSSDQFNNCFKHAKELGERLGIKVTYERSEDLKQRGKTTLCNIPWVSVFVDYRGYVHPCCFYLNLSLGNILKQHLKVIWKGVAYNTFRIKLLKGSVPFCQNCINGKMYLNFVDKRNFHDHRIS